MSSALTQLGYEKSGFLPRNVMYDAEELKEPIRCKPANFTLVEKMGLSF